MTPSSRQVAIGLALLATFLVVIDAPTILRLPAIVAGLIVAPAAALVEHLPRLRRLDSTSVALMFGLASVVVVSEILAIAVLWSGIAVLAAMAAVALTLTAIPWQRTAPRAAPRDGRVDLRLLWLDGRICCSLTIDRHTGDIVDYNEGLLPTLDRGDELPTPASADRPSVVHGDSIVVPIFPYVKQYWRDGRLILDVERQPRRTEDGEAVKIWFGEDIHGESRGGDTIESWAIGNVDGQLVALGLDEELLPVVVTVMPASVPLSDPRGPDGDDIEQS